MLASDINYSKKKKRQEISVEVTFNPKALKGFPTPLAKRWRPVSEFSVIKLVRYLNSVQTTYIAIKPLQNAPPKMKPADMENWINSFLALFKYRYIPAYRIPAQLIKELMIEAQRIWEPAAIKQKLYGVEGVP